MTLSNVAKHAGVSAATVSRVLNRVPGVRPETAKLVHEAASTLGYRMMASRRSSRPRPSRVVAAYGRPAANGRAVEGGRTGNIGLVLLGGFHFLGLAPVFVDVVAGISAEAKHSSQNLLLEEAGTLEQFRRELAGTQMSGVIVVADTLTVDQEAIVQMSRMLPVVWAMGGQVETIRVDHVCPNNMGIGALAHKYLVDQGCGPVAVLSPHPADIPIYWQRVQGFAFSALRSGRPAQVLLCDQDRSAITSLGTIGSCGPMVDQLVEKLLSLSPRPQGVFLPSDNVAKLVHDALVARGVQPGRDITLIGCNNEDGILASIDPRPATITLECVEVGRQAVQRLLWRIQNPYAPPVLMEVAPRLVPPPVESAGELVVLNDLVLNA